MAAVVPHRFLFRYAFQVKRGTRLPKKGRRLLNLPDDCILPDVGSLDELEVYAQLRAAWNPSGLGLSVTVAGKSHPTVCDPHDLGGSDGVELWIDTRDTKNIHRAGRFCHYFHVLPGGSGDDGDEPTLQQLSVPRAREDAPDTSAHEIVARTYPADDGYTLECWFPAESLHGYDPEAVPRLGFFYHLHDAELGDQRLSLGPEFPYQGDPSLWATLELA